MKKLIYLLFLSIFSLTFFSCKKAQKNTSEISTFSAPTDKDPKKDLLTWAWDNRVWLRERDDLEDYLLDLTTKNKDIFFEPMQNPQVDWRAGQGNLLPTAQLGQDTAAQIVRTPVVTAADTANRDVHFINRDALDKNNPIIRSFQIHLNIKPEFEEKFVAFFVNQKLRSMDLWHLYEVKALGRNELGQRTNGITLFFTSSERLILRHELMIFDKYIKRNFTPDMFIDQTTAGSTRIAKGISFMPQSVLANVPFEKLLAKHLMHGLTNKKAIDTKDLFIDAVRKGVRASLYQQDCRYTIPIKKN